MSSVVVLLVLVMMLGGDSRFNVNAPESQETFWMARFLYRAFQINRVNRDILNFTTQLVLPFSQQNCANWVLQAKECKTNMDFLAFSELINTTVQNAICHILDMVRLGNRHRLRGGAAIIKLPLYLLPFAPIIASCADPDKSVA